MPKEHKSCVQGLVQGLPLRMSLFACLVTTESVRYQVSRDSLYAQSFLELIKPANPEPLTLPHQILSKETQQMLLPELSPFLCLLMLPPYVALCGVACYFLLGSVSNNTFQWQLSPDSLALPHLHDNKNLLL